MSFPIHTPETAPDGARDVLAAIAGKYGFLPNLAGAIAESPASLNGLMGLMGAFDAPEMTLTPLERQVVLLAVSAENRCEYCAAAHGMLAGMSGLGRGEVDRVQQGEGLTDGRLEALRRFATAVVALRGNVPVAETDRFLAAGFTRAQVLEVLLGASLKTLTNYTNHIARPPVNAQFAAFLPRWANAA